MITLSHSFESGTSDSLVGQDPLCLLLRERLPHKPYCCNDFYENSPRTLEIALQKKYIQYNPPGFLTFIVVDCDYPAAIQSWYDQILPAPTWTSVNPQNGHAHHVWALKTPVWAGGENKKPAMLFSIVEDSFTQLLKGDVCFTHLLTKNPLSDDWRTCSESGFNLYDLDYLAEFVPATFKKTKKIKQVGESLGRNSLIFDQLRQYAYAESYKHSDPVNFFACVVGHANRINSSLKTPLASNEVLHIAKSVSKWAWKKMSNRSKWASDKGRIGGIRSGAVRYEKNKDKRAQAVLMNEKGMTQAKIADLLCVNQSTVARWLK